MLICVLFFWDLSLSQFWLLPTSSILGCLLALGGVLLLARRMRIVSMDDLLLVGFSWNALLGSIQILLTSLAFDDWQRVPALSAWLFCGLGGRTLPDLLIGLAPALVGCGLFAAVYKSLDVLNLGEDIAFSLGVRVDRLRILSISSVSLLVAVL